MLVKLMCIKSHTSQRGAAELLNLVTLIGRYFQIRDDYMNLTSDEVCVLFSLASHLYCPLQLLTATVTRPIMKTPRLSEAKVCAMLTIE